MPDNIDLLLEKLDKDSLAHRLVKMLKETQKESWPQALERKLTELLHAKKQEAVNAQNSESND